MTRAPYSERDECSEHRQPGCDGECRAVAGDEVNPIASSTASAHFLEGEDRRRGDVDQQVARLVGAYVTTID